MTNRMRHLVILIILLSPLALPSLSYAAGRVFFDSFENGTTNKWQQDSYRNKCIVVSSASDGNAGPHGGIRMLSCNWNGTAAWNDPASFEALELNSWSYSKEFLVRFWVRRDNDLAGGTGPKYYRIGSNSGGFDTSYGVLQSAGYQTAAYFSSTSQIGNTYWGGGSSLGDGSWHKVEIYVKDGTSDGVVRLWEDGVKRWEALNVNTTQNGGTWAKFYISSNWSGSPGCCNHDASNHLYWDEFEIYSDLGTGGTGTLSDATIQGSGNAQLPAPINFAVQ